MGVLIVTVVDLATMIQIKSQWLHDEGSHPADPGQTGKHCTLQTVRTTNENAFV